MFHAPRVPVGGNVKVGEPLAAVEVRLAAVIVDVVLEVEEVE